MGSLSDTSSRSIWGNRSRRARLQPSLATMTIMAIHRIDQVGGVTKDEILEELTSLEVEVTGKLLEEVLVYFRSKGVIRAVYGSEQVRYAITKKPSTSKFLKAIFPHPISNLFFH